MGKAVRRRTVLSVAIAAPMIIGRRASAADRSITVGIYTGQQGDVVRKQIIPPFEAKHQCKVYTTQGVTLEQIALMRATRNNPKYSVMFVDDIGIELAKREGLIEWLPREQIPNMERVLSRFIFSTATVLRLRCPRPGSATTPRPASRSPAMAICGIRACATAS